MSVPIDQSKADMADPEQHFAWGLSSFPVMADGTPMVLPVMSLPLVSRHLWDCGFRHHPELQTIRQVFDANAALVSAGVRWVSVDDEDLVPAPEVDLSNLSDAEAAAVQAALDRRRR